METHFPSFLRGYNTHTLQGLKPSFLMVVGVQRCQIFAKIRFEIQLSLNGCVSVRVLGTGYFFSKIAQIICRFSSQNKYIWWIVVFE